MNDYPRNGGSDKAKIGLKLGNIKINYSLPRPESVGAEEAYIFYFNEFAYAMPSCALEL